MGGHPDLFLSYWLLQTVSLLCTSWIIIKGFCCWFTNFDQQFDWHCCSLLSMMIFKNCTCGHENLCSTGHKVAEQYQSEDCLMTVTAQSNSMHITVLPSVGVQWNVSNFFLYCLIWLQSHHTTMKTFSKHKTPQIQQPQSYEYITLLYCINSHEHIFKWIFRNLWSVCDVATERIKFKYVFQVTELCLSRLFFVVVHEGKWAIEI